MTQLTDKLIAVLVPEDAHKFWINKFVNSTVHSIGFYNNKGYQNFIQVPNIKDYSILGTITSSGEFDFDCEKYVESTNDNPLNASYFNYEIGLFNKNNLEFCKEESFISLLNSKGIFLEKLEGQKILILEKL